MSLKKIYKIGDYIDFKYDAREWKITKVGIKWLHLRNDDLGLITKVLGTDTHYSHRKNKEDIAVKHYEEKMKIKMFNAMKHFKNEKEEEKSDNEEEPKEFVSIEKTNIGDIIKYETKVLHTIRKWNWIVTKKYVNMFNGNTELEVKSVIKKNGKFIIDPNGETIDIYGNKYNNWKNRQNTNL